MNDQPDSISTPREVRATFASADQMQNAVSKLSVSGFDRADLSLPSPGLVQGTETPESGTKPASTESVAQPARTLGASTVAAAVGSAAAGIAVATGGAAVPAFAAAVIAGGVAGGSVFAIHEVAGMSEQKKSRPPSCDLVLPVRAATDAKQPAAEAILRAAGATHIQAVA